MANINVGDRVRVLVDTPEGQPLEGTVRVVQDNPGKKIGVEFDHYVATGHSLDGLLEETEKHDSDTGVTYGKGWWSLEYNLEVLESAGAVS